jgi:photosystem II stability/assembly factor-like uncharacterized protein
MSDNDIISTNQDFVYALAATGTAGERLCFAARQSGLYLSENGGSTWQPAYASLNLDAPLSTTCLALSPSFAEQADLFAGVPGYVMHSTDGGKDWSADPLPLDSCVPTALAISPGFATDGTLFAGTNEDGVLRSTDRGRTWASWNFGLVDFNILCLAVSPAFAEDETVFAGTGSGLFISQSGGRAWKELSLPAGYVPVLSLAVSPGYAQDGTLLAGTEADGLYLSRDRGLSWQRLGASQIVGVLNQVILSPGFPGQGEVLVAHENTVLRSTDGGESWSVLLEGEITALAALWDEAGERTAWVGLMDGTVRRI